MWKRYASTSIAGAGGRRSPVHDQLRWWADRPPSVASFCVEMRSDQVQLNQRGTPKYAELVAAFDRLLRAAPSDIKPDVVTVDAAVKTAQGSEGRALVAFLNPSYLSAAGRFKAYAKNTCGLTLSAHQDAAPRPAIHVTAPLPITSGRANVDLPDPCALVSQATAGALFEASASRERSYGTLGPRVRLGRHRQRADATSARMGRRRSVLLRILDSSPCPQTDRRR